MRTFLIALTSLFWLASEHTLLAQQTLSNPWSFVSENILFAPESERQIIPNKYETASLDIKQLESILQEAPIWFTDLSSESEVVLTLPMPDGTFEKFQIMNAPILHPDLAKKYPDINTYAGTGIDDPSAYIRLDLTPKGFHGLIRSAEHSTVYIDPYAKTDTENYIIYYKNDFQKKGEDVFECSVHENPDKIIGNNPPAIAEAGDCQFRTYRMAVAATGEYTQFHGGTVASSLAAITTTMNRVNSVYEVDLYVTMQLIPNNDQIIYTNGSNDPYNNNNACTMIDENITNVNAVIGLANYDVGHVFATGGSGCAFLGVICSSNKAGGATGIGNPVGDPFDIDYVSHEIGHQFGANHTQNNNCNRNNATAMEPGSASTIMGYAGICSPNVQNNSDDHFHAISIQEMAAHILGSGGSCAAVSNPGNNAPTADAGPNQTVPISTPLALTGVATDADNDPLTYCWEQMDNQVASMPPSSTNTVGPMFRSISPHTSPTRYLPNINDIIANASPTWEVLPSVGRTMNFRLTVRDNHVGGGCTEEDDMVITVDGNSGPFVVTAPNTAVNWPANSQQTVTWNVAGTNTAPVSAANVDIFLSTDGGLTYPITLATGVSNDGSHPVTLPGNQTSTARVMVKGAGNIFFDISNSNFTISAPQNDFTLNVSPSTQSVCAPANATYTVTIDATGGFSGNVTLATANLPTGATSSFSPGSVNVPPSANSTLTIGNTGSLATGTYNFDVEATGSTGTKTETLSLVVTNGVPAQVTLSTPANGATGVSQTPTFTWNAAAGADTYTIEVADDAGFSNIVESASGIAGTSHTSGTALAGNTMHYWRVRATNSCGIGANSTAFNFTTSNETCATYVSTDVPVTIPSNSAVTVTSDLNISASGTITDLNLNNLKITHTWVNDLKVSLTSPGGTTVLVLDQPCNSEDNVDLNFDDEASNSYNSIPCPPIGGGNYQPNAALSAFDGEDLNGTWTLTVEDVFAQDGGTLDSWELEICYTSAPPAQYTLTTNVSGQGSITLNPSGGTYDDGTVVTLTAVPAAGWQFDNWSGDLSGSNNPETITMDANKTVTANFSQIPPNQYTLTTNVSGQGSITLNPPGGTYDDGTVVTLTAVPAAGWQFDNWSGDLSGSNNPETITMDSDKTVTANFSLIPPNQYTLTTNISGQGSISLNPPGGTYDDGTVVTLTAVPASGWQFDNWSGDLSGSNNPETITMDADKNVTANFSPTGGGCTYVTIDTEDFESGWGIWNDGGSDCRRSANDAQYAYSGTFCIRLRDNDPNSSFMTTDVFDWSNYDELKVDFTYITNSMDNSNEDFWLQISTDGGASYTLVEEWNLNDEFQNNVREFDSVVIPGPFTANTTLRFRCDASGNSDWVYIDDVDILGCTGSGPTQYTLTTNVSGQGSISLNPPGGTYDDGTVVTLTAVPASGWQFDGWSGDLSGSNNPETITMDADKNVTATFSLIPPQQYTLTTNVSGQGSITLNPPGGVYDDGTVVTLTAVPASGWQFDNWSGDLSGSNNPETITMDSDKTVTAIFSLIPPQQYTLTTNVSGQGSITLNPSGGVYDDGTVVTLTAIPAAGWQFDNWSGDLSGSNNPETITMDSDKTVTAIFSLIPPQQYTLTTNVSGQGSITLNPPGGLYDDGTVVTLTAAPASGWQFDNWSGDLSGSNNPETITMDSDKTVTANFSLIGGGCTYVVIDDEDFEGGWGIWNDGGSDCRRSINDATWANSGSYCVRLRDNTSTSVMTTDVLDLSSYDELTVDFSYIVISFENVEDFWLQISQDGGSTYTTIEDWVRTIDFNNNERHDPSVLIPGPFTANCRLRFRADASGNGDRVYIDDVVINGCTTTSSRPSEDLPVSVFDNAETQEIEVTSPVEIESKFSISDMKLYPNPTSAVLTVEFEILEATDIQIVVTDLSGKTIMNNKHSVDAGLQQTNIDVRKLTEGYYFVQLISENGRLTDRFIVIK